ncbi:alpha/beta hydrolase [Marinagarivorans cellulosilyticus]|uniref:BD-FAE-like domain-containing protein n=1 Tax=Marinagarivorans cellulosilyticus TaxID=2721545 RepID=A0AAN1WIG7_9GAMM|nr:alpha/beta hydrolase [Marinagarivorans cellulosilyticus]BCD98228.1 hypothetical protein MARGE09_P2429 [Marinagarivorans cellulosilyticus]
MIARHFPQIKAFFISISSLCLAACSPTTLLNKLNSAEKFKTDNNIAYGPHARQALDIYSPPDNNNGCVIVFAYGGSWDSGDKNMYGFVGAALGRKGHTVVIPNYRLYPEVKFPTFVEDFALSIAQPKVQQLIQQKPLILMGHSAGAMLAGLVSFDTTYLEAAGLNKEKVAGYISLSGPHDFFLPSQKPRWLDMFGEKPEQQIQALTVNHIHPDNPPTLLLHGEDDTIVVPESATVLQQKLQSAGVPATAHIYTNVSHKDIIVATSRGLNFLAPTLRDIEQFLKPICQAANR